MPPWEVEVIDEFTEEFVPKADDLYDAYIERLILEGLIPRET